MQGKSKRESHVSEATTASSIQMGACTIDREDRYVRNNKLHLAHASSLVYRKEHSIRGRTVEESVIFVAANDATETAKMTGSVGAN